MKKDISILFRRILAFKKLNPATSNYTEGMSFPCKCSKQKRKCVHVFVQLKNVKSYECRSKSQNSGVLCCVIATFENSFRLNTVPLM